MNKQSLFLTNNIGFIPVALLCSFPHQAWAISKNAYHIVPHKYHDRRHYCLTPKITCRLTQIAWVAIFSHVLNLKYYKTCKQACFLESPCSPPCLYFKALCACCYILPINLSQPLAAPSYSHLVKYRRVIPLQNIRQKPQDALTAVGFLILWQSSRTQSVFTSVICSKQVCWGFSLLG